MDNNYVAEVRRFGSSQPFRDAEGTRRNLSHITNLGRGAVKTDGNGNVTEMPLLEGKPCFGRPERFVRGIFDGKPWVDEGGTYRAGGTPCHSCETKTLGTFLACSDLSIERMESSAAIEPAFVEWIEATGDDHGPRCFVGANGKRWDGFLAAIEAHGGWTNINDDQTKVAAIANAEREKNRRRESENVRRKRTRDLRASHGQTITPEYLHALDLERGRRARHLKSLKNVQGAKPQDTLWLRNLPDATCERIADVWRAKELLQRERGISTGKAIAEQLVANGRAHGMALPTLQARVSEDLKRVAKLEGDGIRAPLWGPWRFQT
ncbi:hypothetical protein EKN06_00475 [Croceicoccus ponticola]|uniref:Uncharacterized protein n=1 Tax=Croceicoccus ponticola TaxID=2217664 RepID=A0A437GZF1_9SPHN|nr:hypothetical protein [Croceicoccus ponticola]RVQ68744.1 hypothetical protein EKN06_00475 [Croceicoccus ponticola]